MRVLVAGATGGLGRSLVEALASEGHEVVALARRPERIGTLGARVAGSRKADVTRPEQLRGACDGVDAVVSAVGLVGLSALRSRATHEAVDHQGNLNLLREAERAGVRKFVYVSAQGADLPQESPLLAAKRALEMDLQASALDWLIVRPTALFHTVADGILEPARRGGVVAFVGDGLARVAPLSSDDAASWIAGNMDRSREVVALGGPDRFTYNGIAELSFQILGKRSRIVHVPTKVAEGAIALARPLPGAAHGELTFLRFAMTHDLVAPASGKRKLRAYLTERAAKA